MPTLLRLAIAAMSTVVTTGGAVLLAFALAPSRATAGPAVFGGAFSLVALTTPPLVIGVFVSYWSWDDSARKRLRILLLVPVAIQVLGVAGVVALIAARPTAVIAGLALIAIGLLENPAAILLGRAARRRELARPQPTIEGAEGELLAGIQRGWRRTAIGASIGLAVGIAGLVALAVAFTGTFPIWRFAFVVPAALGVGASIGSITSTLPLAVKVRDLIGGDYSSGRRIGLAIRGKVTDLTDDEAGRAARYATVAPAWLKLQLTTQVSSLLISISVIANLVLANSDLIVLAALVGGVALASVIAVVVLFRIQIRRFRAYAQAHPVLA